MLNNPHITCNRTPNINYNMGGLCMKGTIYYQKDRNRYAVSFYIAGRKSPVKVTRYKGEFMYHKAIANKCLAMIQNDWEQAQEGLTRFRIEKYTGKGWTDVIEYFEEWLSTKEKKKPATYKGYKSYFKIWIKPFFKKHPVMLHEIQLDTLDKMLDSIKLSGKGKYNVMNCFHAFMDYAWRARRIPEVPPFPKKEDYELVEPTIVWLPEDRQVKVINAIPERDQPIFWWLKYHLRRPSEACSIRRTDYDEFNQVFIVRRSVSARTLVDTTKTEAEHCIPCHSEFLPHMERLLRPVKRVVFKDQRGNDRFLKDEQDSPFLFVNPLARKNGRRYTGESLNRIWKAACEKAGEDIDLYSGLKHSSCSQYVNEKGLSVSDLKEITDHARMESVRKYAKVSVSRKRELMERKLRVVTTTKLPQVKNE